MNVPFVIADATTLTQVSWYNYKLDFKDSQFYGVIKLRISETFWFNVQAGYVGEDVESILYKLLMVNSQTFVVPFRTN